MKMKKVKFNIPLDYVIGHVRSGHKEGVLMLTEEELEELKKDPLDFVYNEDILCELDLVIDSFSVQDYGDVLEVNYEVIDDAEWFNKRIKYKLYRIRGRC